MKLTLLKINTSTIEGYIAQDQLTDKQLKALGLKQDSQFEQEVKFIADIVVNWDDDQPLVQIETLSLFGALDGTTSYGPTGENETYQDNHGMLVYKAIWSDTPNNFTLELKDNEYNYDELCDDAQENGPIQDWYADRQASMIDYAYDTFRDR